MYALIYSLLVLVVDQISKYWVRTHMKPYESIPVIRNVFHLTYLHNTGAAFSMLRGRTVFFVISASAIILIIVYGMIKLPLERRIRFLLALVLGGATGNLIDRVRFGHVVDFLDFRVWPVFNIADCAIVVGMAFLAIIIASSKDPSSLLNNGR